MKSSTLSEWNRLFDEQLNALQIPDQRGKAGKVTAELVRQVVKAAQKERDEGKRIRIKSFTKKLTEQGIVLSSKTVADILIANNLYKVRVKKRRPQFYQSLRQSIPNGLVSVDGKEFKVVIGDEVHTFNLEMSVDVHSFMHSAFSVSDTETTAEFIKVLEGHCAQWGKPLALVTDHGSANLSDRAQAYLQENDIEILPAGPANPKGNGTVESAFSGMEEVIGTLCLDGSSSYSLAKGVLEKIVSVYVTMRNRLARRESRGCPEAMMKTPVKPQQRQDLRERYRQRAESRKKPVSTTKQDRLQWFIDHHGLRVDENSMKRARKCIEHYELEAISKSEEAFLRAIARSQDRCNLAYFFGILRNIQAEMDAARYEEYCQKRYNYQQMKDRERQQQEIEQDQTTTVDVMLETLRAAISCPLTQVKETAMNQARRMALELQKQYRYVAPLKKKVLDVLDGIGELTLTQRNTIVGMVDQFLT
ncbi:MAG: transposase family protein [Thermodesulfobacteriota bacterium]|nr:transposase family protein [Thermodesulfobacteriota bacterium]